MPAGVPDYALGKNLTGMTVTGKIPDAVTGVFGAGSPVSIWAVADELEHQVTPEYEDVRPIWSLQINNVLIGTGNRVRIVCLKRSKSSQALSDLVNGFGWSETIWTEGKETFDGFFAIGELNNTYRGHGAQRVSLDFLPMDPTVAQMVRTVAP